MSVYMTSLFSYMLLPAVLLWFSAAVSPSVRGLCVPPPPVVPRTTAATIVGLSEAGAEGEDCLCSLGVPFPILLPDV